MYQSQPEPPCQSEDSRSPDEEEELAWPGPPDLIAHSSSCWDQIWVMVGVAATTDQWEAGAGWLDQWEER